MIPFIGGITNLFSFVFGACLFSAFQQIDRQKELVFNDFFTWTPKLGKLLLSYLIMGLICMVVFLPLFIGFFVILGFDSMTTMGTNRFGFSIMPNVPFTLLLGSLAYTIFAVLILGIPLFAFMFIVQFKDLSIGDSLKLSWQVGKNNVGEILLFVLLAIGIVILGAIALIIGLFVAMPVIVGIQYYFLRSIFPDIASQEWDVLNPNQPLR
jgi:uncharacterized membrane protein